MAIIFSNDLIQFETMDGSCAIYAILKPGLIVTLDIAKQIVEIRLSIWGEVEKPAIVNANGLVSIEDAARDYWATPESMHLLQSLAIVTNKKLQTMIANFFIRFSKPVVPTRLFSNQEEAIKWANKFC